MSKQLHFKQFSLAYVRSLNLSTQFNCQKTFLFQAIQFSQTVLIETIQFSIRTQFSSIWPIDRTQSGATTPSPEWTRERRQWMGTLHSPELQHHWNLTFRLFSVLSRTLVGGGVLRLFRGVVGVFCSPSRQGNWEVWLGFMAYYLLLVI